MRRYVEERMLPQSELKAIKRRLPTYGRKALRRMENDARNNQTIGEGKWRIIGVDDMHTRHKLRHDITLVERSLDWLRSNGASALEIQQATSERDEAQEALKAFEADRDMRLAQIRAAQDRTEGGLREHCERFLSGCQHVTFKEKLASVPSGKLDTKLTETRDHIRKINTDLTDIDYAPVTLEEATAHIEHDIEKYAKAGAPDIFAALRFISSNSNRRTHGYPRWPEVWTGINSRKIGDGFSLVFWALGDVIREKLIAEAKERIESSAFPPISIAERAPLEEKLRAELLEAERTEEAIINALQTHGDANAVRRHNADPRALLGIEVIQNTVEHQGPGSLTQYEPPKMETPDGQTLRRQSKWMTQGDTAADD